MGNRKKSRQPKTVVRPQAKPAPPQQSPLIKKGIGWLSLAGNHGWGLFCAAGVVLGIVSSILYFRQEISVDPYVSYDTSDPFSQRFEITNTGPFSIRNVFYTCSITHIETGSQKQDEVWNQWVTVMLPIGKHIPELQWKEKTSTDCDFIARFGSDLRTVRIEINVFYRRWPWPRQLHSMSYRFTAKRDTSGKFIWDYGSRDIGAFDDAPVSEKKLMVLQSFMAKPIDPSLKANDLVDISKEDDRTVLEASGLKEAEKYVITSVLP